MIAFNYKFILKIENQMPGEVSERLAEKWLTKNRRDQITQKCKHFYNITIIIILSYIIL